MPNGIWNEDGSLNANAAPLKNHTVCRGAANGGCSHCHTSVTLIVDACTKGSTDAECSWLLQRARKARLLEECNPNQQVSDIPDQRVSEAPQLFHIPFAKEHRVEIDRGPTSVVYGCARRDMVVVLMDETNDHNRARGRRDLIDRPFKDMIIMPLWQLPDRFHKDFPANGPYDPNITDEQQFTAEHRLDAARKILSEKRMRAVAADGGGNDALQSEPAPPPPAAAADGGGGGGSNALQCAAVVAAAAAAGADIFSGGGGGSGGEEQSAICQTTSSRQRTTARQASIRRQGRCWRCGHANTKTKTRAASNTCGLCYRLWGEHASV